MGNKRRGFTMVELLAVIIILGLILAIVVPISTNLLRNSKQKLYDTQVKLIVDAAKVYMSENTSTSYTLGESICEYTLYLQEDLIDNGYIDGPIEDPLNGGYFPDDFEVIVYSDENNILQYLAYNPEVDEKTSYSTEACELSLIEDADTSGANAPNLALNMIPVKWNGSNWVKADVNNSNKDWYDYSNKIWANAVTVTGSSRSAYQSAEVGKVINESDILTYMVWIPRYKYLLFNTNNEGVSEQEIEIKFESGTETTGTGSTKGEYLTHPAFTGSDKITGFWVGKFETTGTVSTVCTSETCTTANLTIKPNLSSVRNQTVSGMFYASRSMSTVSGNQYGYDSNNVDTHMMKNMEWGAVAYLSHSKYGINTEITINNSSTYTTGCAGSSGSASEYAGCENEYSTTDGQLASTTGNIYGVYDMSGGAYEYVMGNMVDSSGVFYSSSAGFTTAPESKYYDSYAYDTSYATHNRGKLGDATRETLKTYESYTAGGWYSDFAVFTYSSVSWFFRGGSYTDGVNAGVFYFNSYTGDPLGNVSFRVVAQIK